MNTDLIRFDSILPEPVPVKGGMFMRILDSIPHPFVDQRIEAAPVHCFNFGIVVCRHSQYTDIVEKRFIDCVSDPNRSEGIDFRMNTGHWTDVVSRKQEIATERLSYIHLRKLSIDYMIHISSFTLCTGLIFSLPDSRFFILLVLSFHSSPCDFVGNFFAGCTRSPFCRI